jgi:hypothetical protein
LKIVGACKLALRESFVERTVIAEAGRDVPPFREERFVRRTAREVSTDGHRAKSAAVIALPPRENAIAILVADFKVKLAREFNGGFRCFGASRCEVNAAAVAKIRRSHREQPLSKFFRRSSMKLRSVRESNLRRLLRHGAAYFSNAVTDADNRCLSGGVEKSMAVLSNDPATFSTRRDRKRLFEIAGEKSAARWHVVSGKGL